MEFGVLQCHLIATMLWSMSIENNQQTNFKYFPFFFRFACLTALFAAASYVNQIHPFIPLSNSKPKDRSMSSNDRKPITSLSLFSDTINPEGYPDNWLDHDPLVDQINTDQHFNGFDFFSDETTANLRTEPKLVI